MDYLTYFMEQAIDADGPHLTDHGPATPDRDQAERRFTRRDNYRAIVTIHTEYYLADIEAV